MTPLEIFNHLQGDWALHRVIKPGGVMQGRAVFNKAGENTYDYQERGQLIVDGNTPALESTRQYTYRLIDGDIQVYYADGPDKGDLFHALSFSGEDKANAEHLCVNDLYVSEYDFRLPHNFQITHRVTGPKKDYVSVTDFKRSL